MTNDIDIENETIISLPGLAGSLPGRRRNRSVHVTTVHRWRSPGIRGIRLEAIRVGGAWHTTWEAFARFCERLTAAETGEDAAVVTTAGRRDAHRRADAELDGSGW